MPSAQQVVDFYKKNPNASTEEAAKILGLTKNSLKTTRVRLIAKGLLEKQNPNQRHDPALIKECLQVGISPEAVSNYWYKGKHFSIHVRNQQVSLTDIADLIIGEMKSYSPKIYKTKPYKKGNHLLVINPADIHIGKLCSEYETGDKYNANIARERVLGGVQSLITKSTMFGVDKIVTVIGNDILHTDNAKSTTTSGTHQDTDMMWYDAFNFAFKLYIEAIENLAQLAPVHIAHNPSNHDYVSGYMLAQSVQAWFRNHKGITFDVSPAHRKYVTYGQNLIGMTHGDGAKCQDLPLLMAHESKDWNNCKHRYIYTNHIHHKSSKDIMSVNVESFRSPSGTDSWHHRNGYQHSPKAIEAFIHHKDNGQIARLTEIFT